MNTFVTTAYEFSPTHNFGPQWLKEHSDQDGLSYLSEDPAAADCILFVENHPAHDPYFFTVLRSALYRQFRNKCVLYHDADLSVTQMPTISPSIERWQMAGGAKKSVHYVARLSENTTVNGASPNWTENRKYTYSFVGSTRTHPLRAQLFKLSTRGGFLLDTNEQRSWAMSDVQKHRYEAEYLRIAYDSYFILCPRGIGPCTYRLFETMQLGRAPIIISDQWVAIDEIAWDEFSIRVKEREVANLGAVLEARKHEAVNMGKLARKAWETNFSPQSSLRMLTRAAFAVLARPYSFMDSLLDRRQFFTRYHSRGLLRYYKNRALRQMRT
jgi:hypothetical protein